MSTSPSTNAHSVPVYALYYDEYRSYEQRGGLMSFDFWITLFQEWEQLQAQYDAHPHEWTKERERQINSLETDLKL